MTDHKQVFMTNDILLFPNSIGYSRGVVLVCQGQPGHDDQQVAVRLLGDYDELGDYRILSGPGLRNAIIIGHYEPKPNQSWGEWFLKMLRMWLMT